LAKSGEEPEVFYQKLKARYDAYREISKAVLLDYPEIELWQQIMLPDVDGEYVAAHAQEFTTTILSSKVRLRKPDPAIYHLACRCCGVSEANCVYIGDNPDPDVEGTRAAGYGCMVLIDDPKKGRTEKMRASCDCLIENLSELLDLFPAKN